MILTPDEIIVIVAEKVAYDLLGSCGNFPDEVEHLTRESTLFCSTVDDITMECTCCGWWCEAGEVNIDGVCEDCAETEEDDDED